MSINEAVKAHSAGEFDEVVTWMANGDPGVHYRPHRDDPKNFVVVKILLRAGGLSLSKTKAELANFLKGLGGSFQIKKGRYKWVAIAPRDKVEKEAKKKAKHSLDLPGETQQQQKAKKKAKYSLDMPGGQKQGQQQKVYSLSMSVLPDLRDALAESMGLEEAKSVKTKWTALMKPFAKELAKRGVKYKIHAADGKREFEMANYPDKGKHVSIVVRERDDLPSTSHEYTFCVEGEDVDAATLNRRLPGRWKRVGNGIQASFDWQQRMPVSQMQGFFKAVLDVLEELYSSPFQGGQKARTRALKMRMAAAESMADKLAEIRDALAESMGLEELAESKSDFMNSKKWKEHYSDYGGGDLSYSLAVEGGKYWIRFMHPQNRDRASVSFSPTVSKGWRTNTKGGFRSAAMAAYRHYKGKTESKSLDEGSYRSRMAGKKPHGYTHLAKRGLKYDSYATFSYPLHGTPSVLGKKATKEVLKSLEQQISFDPSKSYHKVSVKLVKNRIVVNFHVRSADLTDDRIDKLLYSLEQTIEDAINIVADMNDDLVYLLGGGDAGVGKLDPKVEVGG